MLARSRTTVFWGIHCLRACNYTPRVLSGREECETSTGADPSVASLGILCVTRIIPSAQQS